MRHVCAQATALQLERLQKRTKLLQQQLEEAVSGRTKAEVALRKGMAEAQEAAATRDGQARTVVQNLQTELGGTRKQLEAAEKAIADLRGRLTAMAEGAKKAHATASTLEDALRLKKSEVEALKVAVTRAQADSGTASAQAEKQGKELATAKANNEELQQRLTAAEQTIAEANRRLAAAGQVRVLFGAVWVVSSVHTHFRATHVRRSWTLAGRPWHGCNRSCRMCRTVQRHRLSRSAIATKHYPRRLRGRRRRPRRWQSRQSDTGRRWPVSTTSWTGCGKSCSPPTRRRGRRLVARRLRGAS